MSTNIKIHWDDEDEKDQVLDYGETDQVPADNETILIPTKDLKFKVRFRMWKLIHNRDRWGYPYAVWTCVLYCTRIR